MSLDSLFEAISQASFLPPPNFPSLVSPTPTHLSLRSPARYIDLDEPERAPTPLNLSTRPATPTPEKPVPSPSPSSSSSSSARLSNPPIEFAPAMIQRMVIALETLAEHATHRCCCQHAAPSTSATSPTAPPSASVPSTETTSPPLATHPGPTPRRRSSVEDIIDSVVIDESIVPTFRPTSARPAQHKRHKTQTRATGRPYRRT